MEPMLRIRVNDREIVVLRRDYVEAKTLDLRASGFPSVTEAEISEQLNCVLAGGELTVIGKFIEPDIIGEEP